MLKTIKYEFRQNRNSYIVLLVIYALIEAYFLFGMLAENGTHTAVALILLLLSSPIMYFYVLYSSIASYKRDIENKSGYLVFMTPVSTYSVIGAKLITALITGVIVVCLIGGCFFLDYSLLMSKFSGLDSAIKLMKSIFEDFSVQTSKLLLAALSLILQFLISFYLFVTLAYLAISLASTVLQNKRGKKLISFIIFIILYAAVTLIANQLPHIGDINDLTGPGSALIYNLPTYALFILAIAGSFLASAWLLDNKISL